MSTLPSLGIASQTFGGHTFVPPASLFLTPGNFDASAPCRRAQETSLLEQLASSEPTDCFVAVERLQTLYSRHLKAGGIQGLQWLSAARAALETQIREEHLYGDFLREDGERSFLDLPRSLKRPSALRLAEDMTVASVIYLPYEDDLRTGAMAYFRIEDLILGQDILSERKLALFGGLLASLTGFSPIVIAKDLAGRGYHLHDGHHRGHSAMHTGHRYILGKMNREAKIRRCETTWSTIAVLPHEEFNARIEPDASMAFREASLDEDD